jgi:hypothetical protein
MDIDATTRTSASAFAAIVAVCALLQFTPLTASLDRAILDAQYRLLFRHVPVDTGNSIVVIGIDEAPCNATPSRWRSGTRRSGDCSRR